MSLIQHDDPYSSLEYVHPNSGDSLRIVPERGGLLTGWCCGGEEILYFDQKRFADTSKSIRGGMPILFPICGDLPGDVLRIRQEEFVLKQHGFARDLSWKSTLLDDDSGVKLTLSDTYISRKMYPFLFKVVIVLRPLKNSLVISIRIQNSGTDPMPFSFGIHPYFVINDLDSVRIEGLAQTCFSHIDKAETQTNLQLARLSKGVDFITTPIDKVRLVDMQSGRKVTMQAKAPMDMVVVWTDPPRNMVCLEPWTAPREALVSGNRRIVLEPGCVQDLECRYLID